MAQQTIGLGTTANDGTGDNARVAGDKINDNFTELYAAISLDSATASTAGGTITLDMNSYKQRMFVGSASFATPKTMALSNTTNALIFSFTFEVTNIAATLTVPASWLMSSTDFDGTIWTPPTTGKYEIGGSWNGTNWFVKIAGPFI